MLCKDKSVKVKDNQPKKQSNYTMCVLFSRSPRFGSSRSGPPPGRKFGNPGDRLRKKRWDLDELPKFEKNFYAEHSEVQRMSQVHFKHHTLIP